MTKKKKKDETETPQQWKVYTCRYCGKTRKALYEIEMHELNCSKNPNK